MQTKMNFKLCRNFVTQLQYWKWNERKILMEANETVATIKVS